MAYASNPFDHMLPHDGPYPTVAMPQPFNRVPVFSTMGRGPRGEKGERGFPGEASRKDFETVADMVAEESLEAGDICRTLGFHEAGDGGAAWYKVTDDATANGMDIIALDNGLYAELQITEAYVTPEMFGTMSNIDSSNVFNRIFTLSLNIDGMNNIYLISNQLTPISDVYISNCKFDLTGVNGIFNRTSILNSITLRNCEFFNSSTRVTGQFSQDAAVAIIARYVNVDNCIIHDNAGNGLILYYGNGDNSSLFENVSITNCVAYNNGVYQDSLVSSGVGIGAYLDPSNNNHNVTIENCVAYENASSGIAPHGCNNVVIKSCTSYNNYEHGFVFQDSDNCSIDSCAAYGNSSRPLRIQGNFEDENGYCNRVSVTNNKFKTWGVLIGYNVTNVIIENNFFDEISLATDTPLLAFDRPEKPCSNIVFKNNIINHDIESKTNIAMPFQGNTNILSYDNIVNGDNNPIGGSVLSSDALKRRIYNGKNTSLLSDSYDVTNSLNLVNGTYVDNVLTATGNGVVAQTDSYDIPENCKYIAFYTSIHYDNAPVGNQGFWQTMRLRNSGGGLIQDLSSYTDFWKTEQENTIETCVVLDAKLAKSNYDALAKIQFAIGGNTGITGTVKNISASFNGVF